MDHVSSKRQAVDPPPRLPRRLLLIMSACSIAMLALLWGSRFLPMADLPQHEAQLALWLRMGEGGAAARVYELNLLTPYLLYALLGRLLATVFPVWVALRCILCLAALGLPWSLLVLLRRTGGDSYWALVGFPLVFGVSFYWGFLNYLLALPLGVLFLALVFRHAEKPTRKGAIGLGVAACGVFLCHPLVWAPLVLVGSASGLCRRGLNLEERLRGLVPVVPSVVLAVFWQGLARFGGSALPAGPSLGTQWAISPLRLGALPTLWIGYDGLALAAVVGLGLGLVLSARGISRRPSRWIVALLGVVGFALGPETFSDVSFLYQRSSILVALLALVALEPRKPSRRRKIGRALLAGVALAWCAVLGLRFDRFQVEGDAFRTVTQSVPPGAHVLGLVADPKVEPLPGSTLLHFAAYLQVEHDLSFEHTMARYRHMTVVFREEALPPWAPRYELERPTPALVADELREGHYDYVLVRSIQNPAERFPPLASWKRVATDGAWVLFKR